jgi:uncharacterized membrane protein YfcA
MEITYGLFLLILSLSFTCEFIDSSLGMGYGTILSPILIILGFNPLLVVPAILLSQAFGGMSASIFHHKFENVSFKFGSRDLNLVLIISSFGILATVFAACIAVNLPKKLLNSYIGILVLIMGLILLRPHNIRFSWKKMVGVGFLSGFNKGISGGGFGPVVMGGQILAGGEYRAAVGITTLAEPPICICGFFTYLIGRIAKEIDGSLFNRPFADLARQLLSARLFQWEFILALLLGAIFVGPFGALTTKNLKSENLRLIISLLISVLGLWTLIKTWF